MKMNLPTFWVRSAALLSIILLFLSTWGLAGPGKLTGGLPPWFADKFGSTFLATFPGLTVSFYSVVLGEVLAALLALVALVRLEFLPGRSTAFTQYTLVASLFLFAQLGFGQRLVQENSGAASLFFYFGATLLALIFVRQREG
jgi:hypothetical protein